MEIKQMKFRWGGSGGKQNGAKCFVIKKQIEPCCFGPS